jgi:hypothetical protein
MADSLNYLATEFVKAIPHIAGALLVLIVGYIVSRVVRTLVKGMLVKLGMDRAIQTSPGGNLIGKVTKSPAGLVGAVAFWMVFLGAISLAVSVLGITALSAVVAAIYSYLPNVIATLLILMAAIAISAAVSGFVMKVMGETPTGKMVAGIAPGLIMSIAVFMALNQLQIAPDIVTITYAAIIGSVALGTALAFGLGGSEVASQMLQDARAKSQEQIGQMRSDLATGKQNSQVMAQDVMKKLQENDSPKAASKGFSAAPSFGENIDSFRPASEREARDITSMDDIK